MQPQNIQPQPDLYMVSPTPLAPPMVGGYTIGLGPTQSATITMGFSQHGGQTYMEPALQTSKVTMLRTPTRAAGNIGVPYILANP